MTVFLFLIIGLLVAGLFNYFRAKRKNVLVPETKNILTDNVSFKPKKKSSKVNRVVKFIPYYKWKGWQNGLQPSTKQDILNEHKRQGLI